MDEEITNTFNSVYTREIGTFISQNEIIRVKMDKKIYEHEGGRRETGNFANKVTRFH